MKALKLSNNRRKIERILLVSLLLCTLLFSVNLFVNVTPKPFWLSLTFLLFSALVLYYMVLHLRSIYGLVFLVFLIGLAGIFFKLMHWSGAGLLLSIGHGLGETILIPLVLFYAAALSYKGRMMVKLLLFLVGVLLAIPVGYKLLIGYPYIHTSFNGMFLMGLVLLSKFTKVFRTTEKEGRVLNVIGFEALLVLIFAVYKSYNY